MRIVTDWYTYRMSSTRIGVISRWAMVSVALVVVLFPFSSFAAPPVGIPGSAPAPGYVPPQPVEGTALTITWQSPRSQPRAAFWIDSVRNQVSSGWAPIVEYDENLTSCVLPRRGLCRIPTKVAIIPRNRRMAPQVVTVAEDVRRIAFVAQPLPPRAVAIWGRHPLSPGSFGYMPMNPVFADGSRDYFQGRLPNNLQGSFLYLYTAPDSLEVSRPVTLGLYSGGNKENLAVSIEGFTAPAADAAAQFANHVITLIGPPSIWGRSARMTFDVVADLNLAI